MRRRLTLCLLLGACQANPPPAEHQPPATPAPPAQPADPPPAQPDPQPAQPADPPPADPPTAPVPSTSPAAREPLADIPSAPAGRYTPGPLAVAAVERGALLVWSRHDAAAGKSEILARLLDERGAPRSDPRLVRRTSGHVRGLAVDRRDGAAWIAWAAQLAEPPELQRALVAAVQVEPDLSAMRPPVTLAQFVDPNLGAWSDRIDVDVLALADGGAAVASGGSQSECVDIVTDRKVRCSGFDLHWLRADGTHTLAGKTGADGGDPGMLDLVDIGTGVLLDVIAWHGGATHATLHAAYHQPATPAPHPIHHCRPSFTRAWTGRELVTICPDDYTADDCPGGSVSTEEGACTRVHTAIAGDRSVPLRAETRACADGHPVVDLDSSAGKIRLDPAAPGASIDLGLGVWTGTHLLAVADGGARELWTCNKSGRLVPADAPGDDLSLDPDPARVQSIPARPL